MDNIIMGKPKFAYISPMNADGAVPIICPLLLSPFINIHFVRGKFSNWNMPAGLGKEVPYKKSCDDGNKEK